MAEVDLSKCMPEQCRAYSRMLRGAGKGDQPRNIWSPQFRENYARINWSKGAKSADTQDKK